jgi:hypothetical protein
MLRRGRRRPAAWSPGSGLAHRKARTGTFECPQDGRGFDRRNRVDGALLRWPIGGTQDWPVKFAFRSRRSPVAPAAFTGFRFPAEVIVVAVRWNLRHGLSYSDLEELLAERGIEVDHVTVYRWVHRFTTFSPTRLGGLGTRLVIDGSSMRLM